FDGPLELTFDWRWVDLGEWPLYADILTVNLRTSGKHKAEHAYEATDGLCIELNAVEHSVRAAAAGERPFKSSAPDAAPMRAGVWHSVRIVDDGRAVSVFIEGPSIDPRYRKEPVLTVNAPAGLTGKRIAFFNRESVAGTNHESHLDNVRVRAA